MPVTVAINPRDTGEGGQYATEVSVYKQRGDYKEMWGLVGGGGLSDWRGTSLDPAGHREVTIHTERPEVVFRKAEGGGWSSWLSCGHSIPNLWEGRKAAMKSFGVGQTWV